MSYKHEFCMAQVMFKDMTEIETNPPTHPEPPQLIKNTPKSKGKGHKFKNIFLTKKSKKNVYSLKIYHPGPR